MLAINCQTRNASTCVEFRYWIMEAWTFADRLRIMRMCSTLAHRQRLQPETRRLQTTLRLHSLALC